MLKLKQWLVPTWVIDWVNKVFKTDKIIWRIQSIYVDGTLIKEYTSDILTITLDVAPTNSIIVNYFYREVNNIRWNGEVVLWDLLDQFYRKIGRVNADWTIPSNIWKLYPADYVKRELRKSIKRITNKIPSNTRLQQYSIKSINGYTITNTTSENVVTFEEKLTNEIEGMFMIKNSVTYNYYGLENNMFQVADIDLSEMGDKIIIWYRIPYGVQKISTLLVDGKELKYVDERDFNFTSTWEFTIIKDFQWNEYLFLPYSDTVKTYTIKYIPEIGDLSDENDIVDVPEEYIDVFVYDVAIKLLKDKEDERWMAFKEELWNGKRYWLLKEYQSFAKSQIEKPRAQIWFAKTI